MARAAKKGSIAGSGRYREKRHEDMRMHSET